MGGGGRGWKGDCRGGGIIGTGGGGMVGGGRGKGAGEGGDGSGWKGMVGV